MFQNLGFLKSKFSCLTVGEYRENGCLNISDFVNPSFLENQKARLRNQKARLIKVGGEKICDIQDIHVFDLVFAHSKFKMT